VGEAPYPAQSVRGLGCWHENCERQADAFGSDLVLMPSGNPRERAVRVLLVDDDEYIRSFVSLALADEGYEVLTAAHGRAPQ